MIVQRENRFAINFGQENWIFLAHVRAIQVLPREKITLVRVTWSNGDTDFFEGEDALEIIKSLTAIKKESQ